MNHAERSFRALLIPSMYFSVILLPMPVVAQISDVEGQIMRGARFPNPCRNREAQYNQPARMPVDLIHPESRLILYSGESLCVRLAHYSPIDRPSEQASLRNKMWSAGSISLVGPGCPIEIMGAEGLYSYQFYTPRKSPPPSSLVVCGDAPDDKNERAYLLAMAGETTVVTWKTETTSRTDDWDPLKDIYGYSASRPDSRTLISIPAGEFFMGCDASSKKCPPEGAPGHQIELKNNFLLMDAEVSLGDYLAGQRANSGLPPVLRPLRVRDSHMAEGLPLWLPLSYPATMVTWEEAADHCRHLGGRLPTEAEWERAARLNQAEMKRADTDHTDLSPPREIAAESLKARAFWSDHHFGSTITPVRSERVGVLGLHDLNGNVSEWVEDWFDPKYFSERRHDNPEGAYLGKRRMVRGAACRNVPLFTLQGTAGFTASQEVIAWTRFSRDGSPAPDIGFRCAFD